MYSSVEGEIEDIPLVNSNSFNSLQGTKLITDTI